MAPDVVGKVGLSLVKQSLQRRELSGAFIEFRWLGNDRSIMTNFLDGQITNSDGDQVRWHLDLVFERPGDVCVVPSHVTGGVGAHVNLKVVLGDDGGVVWHLDGWGVLHRCNRPASDVFTLRVEVGQLLTGGLRWLQPADSGRIFVCDVPQSDLDLKENGQSLRKVHLNGVSEVVVWASHIELRINPILVDVVLSSLNIFDLGLVDAHALSIEERRVDVWLVNAHGVDHVACEELFIEVHREVELHVSGRDVIDVRVGTRIN